MAIPRGEAGRNTRARRRYTLMHHAARLAEQEKAELAVALAAMEEDGRGRGRSDGDRTGPGGGRSPGR